MSEAETDETPVESRAARNVWTLGLTSFLTDVSTEMILSIFPLFVTGELGASTGVLGLIEGASETVNYSSRTVSGFFSDRIRRRRLFVLIGYGLSTLAKPFFAAAHSWPEALAVRITDRVGKGVRTSPRDALLSDSAPEGKVGRAFGIHRSLDQAGAVVGPVIAVLFLTAFPGFGFRGVFLLSLVPGALSVLVLWRWVVEVRGSGSGKARGSFREALNPGFAAVLFSVGLFGAGSYDFSFILLRSSQLGLAAALVPLVYGAINVSHSLIGFPAGSISDRVGREAALILGYIVFFVASVFAILSRPAILDIFVLALLFGLYLGVVETGQRAIVPKFVRSEHRGTGYGVYYLVVGGTTAVGNIVFGLLWQLFGSQTAFAYSAVMSVISVFAFLFVIFRARAAPTLPSQI